MGMDINERREVWTVLNISRDEIEFQCDNDIIVVRVPNPAQKKPPKPKPPKKRIPKKRRK